VRLLPLLVLVSLASAGCAKTTGQKIATCTDARVRLPKITIPSGNYGLIVKIPPAECGRVFDRSMIAAAEQRLKIRVTGVRCDEFGGGPSCYMETAHGCVAAIPLGPRRQFIFRRVPRSAFDRFCSNLRMR